MTLWPLMRPISGNVTLPTPVRILLGKLTYHIGIVNLRNKGLNWPKKQKKLIYFENLLFFMIYDIMAPNTPPNRECDATYPCSHFTWDTYLSYRHSQFKKIRG